MAQLLRSGGGSYPGGTQVWVDKTTGPILTAAFFGPTLTRVTADYADSYTVIARVSSDIADAYTVRAQVTQDVADSFVVRQLALSAYADAYAVRQLVLSDLSDAWINWVRVDSSFADTYTVLVRLYQDLSDAYAILADTQYARPSADITAGAWLPSTPAAPLYSMIDEAVPDDNDYIYAGQSGSMSEVALQSSADPGATYGHSVLIRAKGNASQPLRVHLMEGTTQIAVWDRVLAATPTTYELPLTRAERAAIVDYTNLRFRFTGL
jgi:hypothetical protein